jgi:hypothetical protein
MRRSEIVARFGDERIRSWKLLTTGDPKHSPLSRTQTHPTVLTLAGCTR